MTHRKEIVMKALRKLGVASPSEIWKVAMEMDPEISLQDINFEIEIHGAHICRRKEKWV